MLALLSLGNWMGRLYIETLKCNTSSFNRNVENLYCTYTYVVSSFSFCIIEDFVLHCIEWGLKGFWQEKLNVFFVISKLPLPQLRGQNENRSFVRIAWWSCSEPYKFAKISLMSPDFSLHITFNDTIKDIFKTPMIIQTT
jgi:hypothetical protein